MLVTLRYLDAFFSFCLEVIYTFTNPFVDPATTLYVWFPYFNKLLLIRPWRSVYWFLMAVITIGRCSLVTSYLRNLVQYWEVHFPWPSSLYFLWYLLSHDLVAVVLLIGLLIVEIFQAVIFQYYYTSPSLLLYKWRFNEAVWMSSWIEISILKQRLKFNLFYQPYFN